MPTSEQVTAPVRSVPAERARHRWGAIWPCLLITAVLVVPRFVVSPFLPTPLLDDWLYQLSVKRLIEHHQLWVSPLAVATLVGQIGWGALFALPFGVSPAVLRISTLVASLAGACGLYLMYRELGAAWRLAVAGALAVWLHPVTFVLSYTFMTDVPFLALACLAGWLYLRGVMRASHDALLFGSVCAGGAFLVRQQGALLPVAVVLWLLLYRPVWFGMRRWRTIAATVVPCLVAVAGYYGLALAAGLPSMQATFFRTLLDAGPVAILDQLWRIAVIAFFYAGLCFLPLLAGAAARGAQAPRSTDEAGSSRLNATPGAVPGEMVGQPFRQWLSVRQTPAARLVATGCLLLMLGWTLVYAFHHHGSSFPFLAGGQMIRPDGFATDAYGARPDLLPKLVWLIVSVMLAFATSAAALMIVGRVFDPPRTALPAPTTGSGGGGEGVLLGLFAFVQLGGIIPASLYRPELITYDRYLLPVFPFAVGLLIWAQRDRAWSLTPAMVVLAVLLAVNTLGVQDWFAYKRAEWATDEWLTTTRGVPLDQVDGYGQWIGLHFYERTIFGPPQTPVAQPGAPWWLDDIAPGLDPVYVVAAAPDVRAGYTVVAKRPYRSWVRPADDSWVYVLKRDGTP